MTIAEYKELCKNDQIMIGQDVVETKTQRVMNRIVQVENFQNMACCCANWQEFVEELAEWGVDSTKGIDFDDSDLDYTRLDAFIKAENGYIKEGK